MEPNEAVEPLKDIERIEHELDERIEALKREAQAERRPPVDDDLAKVFPTDPPAPGAKAPKLGS
jgi:hypothetical protein